MQPSLTPSAPCQPTVVASSVSVSYWAETKVAAGQNLLQLGGPCTHYSPSACYKMAPRRLRVICLFSALSGIGGLLGS